MAYGPSPDEQIAVIINNRDEETDVEVPVWELGMDCIHDKVMEQVFIRMRKVSARKRNPIRW